MAHLLLVDPSVKSRSTLVQGLKTRGHRVTAIDTPDALPAAMAIHSPDNVLMALSNETYSMIVDACQRLRAWSSIPIIFMSDHVDESLKVRALDSGADDFITHPIGVDELLARIRAIHRRTINHQSSNSPILRVGNMTVDLNNRLVVIGSENVQLTRKEYALLRVLALSQGRIVTYEALLKEIWGREGINERACVRTLVKQLRRKLGEDLENPIYILTQAGVGYRLNVEKHQQHVAAAENGHK